MNWSEFIVGWIVSISKTLDEIGTPNESINNLCFQRKKFLPLFGETIWLLSPIVVFNAF